jgi:hypothetical protein
MKQQFLASYVTHLDPIKQKESRIPINVKERKNKGKKQANQILQVYRLKHLFPNTSPFNNTTVKTLNKDT